MKMPLARDAMLTMAIILALGSATALGGQSPSEPLIAFDVSSIRPSEPAQTGGEGSLRSQIEAAPDGVVMRNVDLREMIVWAYGLEDYQVLTSTAQSERYDVRARAGEQVSDSMLKRMMQNLLATRFKLQVHREQKARPVYELVVGKGGPKLPKDKSGTLPPGYPRESLPRVVEGSFAFSNVSMSEFVQQLSEIRGIDLPVVDRTGIAGVYDITLKAAASAVLDPQGTSLLTLIQEQLGLKLVAAKDPVEVLVVDHAEQPSEN